MNFLKLHNILSILLKKDSLFWKLLESVFSIRYFFSYHLHYRSRSTTTREIYIEFVSYCNLRCSLCSLDHTKTKYRIDISTMERIFDQLYYDRRFRKVGIIHLHNAGEALLHPEFRNLVQLIGNQKKRFHQAGYNFPQVAIVTNATILKPELSDFIIESGVFDFVRFSMDGGAPEAFEQLRLRAKWNDFYENVSYFLKQNKKHSAIHTAIITLIESSKKRSIKWMNPQFQELFKLADSYEIRYPHNWRGEVDLNDSRNLEKNLKLGCSMLIKQLVILPNGDVTICCSDLNSQGVIGNINRADLYSIYKSPKRQHIIDMLYRGKKHLTDLCKDCPTY